MQYASRRTDAVACAPVSARADFLRKAYGLFFASLLVTISVGAVCARPAALPIVGPLV